MDAIQEAFPVSVIPHRAPRAEQQFVVFCLQRLARPLFRRGPLCWNRFCGVAHRMVEVVGVSGPFPRHPSEAVRMAASVQNDCCQGAAVVAARFRLRRRT